MKFIYVELDDKTRIKTNQDICRYDSQRRPYNTKAHLINAFLSEENYNKKIYKKKVNLTDKQHNLINVFSKTFPHFGLKVEDNEFLLALDKMTTSESLLFEEIGMLTTVLSRLDFIHIISFYKRNGNDVKAINILIEYKK